MNGHEYRENLANEILQERIRQIMGEGFSPVRDDKYVDGELGTAAACFAYSGIVGVPYVKHLDASFQPIFEPMWPEDWPVIWLEKHRGQRRKKLIIAASLLMAEIERLDRLKS